MVQIPEYTRRENARPMQRGGMSLSVPGALTDPSVGNVASKKILGLSKDLADVVVNMKERRDDGIVSAFMNQYDKDSTDKLLQLKDRYRGQDSRKVMSEFQKWRDTYISEHSSYDPDSAKEGVVYLEDDAQNRIAKQKLDAANVRDINSISAYIAREEEGFRVNNIKVSVENSSLRIMSEDILPNAEIEKTSIASNIADLYRGQSKEFIKKATDDVLDGAIYSNIMRNSQSDPLGSIARYNDKTFTRELSDSSRMKAKEELIKSFKNYTAQVMAEDAAYQKPSSLALPSLLNNEFFSGVDVNKLMREITDEAGRREKDILQTKHENSVRLQNDMILKVVNPDGTINPNALTPEDMMNISATEGGAQTINLLNQVRVNTQNDNYNIENGLERLPLSDNDLVKYNTIMNRVNTGYYSTLGEMYDDISMMPAVAQNEIVGTFIGNLKYNKDVGVLKDKGIDIEKEIKSSYKLLFGLDPNNNDSSYRMFRNDMIDKVRGMQIMGDKLDTTSIKVAAQSVRENIDEGHADMYAVRRVVMDLDRKRKENYSAGEIQDYSDLQKWAAQASNDADLDDVFDKASMKRFNDLIINGDVEGAILMLNYYRANKASYEKMKQPEREARKRNFWNNLSESYNYFVENRI